MAADRDVLKKDVLKVLKGKLINVKDMVVDQDVLKKDVLKVHMVNQIYV